MSTTTTAPGEWGARVRGGGARPSAADLRVADSRGIHTRMVAASGGIFKALQHLRDNPGEFFVSTATSMAMFMSVKAALFALLPATVGALAIGMLTAGVIAAGRTVHKAVKERRKRVEALYYSSLAPSVEDLAAAKAISIAGVFSQALHESVFSGLLSGITGITIGHVAQGLGEAAHAAAESKAAAMAQNAYHHFNLPPISQGYHDFLESLSGSESGGNYAIQNYAGFSGKYQFGESALTSIGLYTPDGTSTNDWAGSWTPKAQAMGVSSIQDFLHNPAAQEMAQRDWMAYLWENNIVKPGLDQHIGQVVNGVKITESGLLAGAHMYPNRIDNFVLQGVDSADGNGTLLSSYVRKFGGFAVPFEAGNPEEILYIDPNCHSQIAHIWPILDDLKPEVDSPYGMRYHPILHYDRLHAGVDIDADTGDVVIATADGVVEKSGVGGGLGNRVVIRHIDGSSSVYGHLSRIDVPAGTVVKQGMNIGAVGETGLAEAPHLHYELHDKSGASYDPTPCLPPHFRGR